jgi:hypothetical protein
MTKANTTVNAETQTINAEAQETKTEENLQVVPAEIGGGFIAEKQMTGEQMAEAMKVLSKVSAYVGGTAHRVDEFLGQVVTITGAITQPVQIGHEFTNKETGEVSRAYEPAIRTIFMLENREVISLVSKSAESFVNTFIFPFFGKGDFPAPIKLKITQIPKGQNRTFNFQIVG